MYCCAGYLARPFSREIVGTNYFSLQDPSRAIFEGIEMGENSTVWPNINNDKYGLAQYL